MSQAVSEEAKRVLHELGLTRYEYTVYLSLVEKGVMTASDVSESAGVPFSKVYEVLNSLERKGWVDAERGRPSRYFAKSPIEAFAASKNELDKRIQSWQETMTDELQPLYEKRELREKPDIWILRGEASVLSKLQEMVEKARREVMIAAPLFVRSLAERSMPLVAGLRLDRVKALVMVAGKPEDWGLASLPGVEVRTRGNMFGGGVIVDGEEALLFLGEEEKPSLVVWSNHGGLVKFAKDYFRYLWESSESS